MKFKSKIITEYLDSNKFMTSMGNYLKKSKKFIFDEDIVNGRKTTVWTAI